MRRHHVLLQAVRPVAHGDTRTGINNPTNTRLFLRQRRLVNGRPAWVPSVSENALRSVGIRQPLADHLMGECGIGVGELPKSVVALHYTGGKLNKGASAPLDENTLGHQVRRLYPSLELLGGAVDDFILPRGRLRLAAWIVAAEYADSLALIGAPADVVARARAVSAFDLLGEEVRTRGTTAGEGGGDNQMLYSYEVLAEGVEIYLEATLEPTTSPAAAGALALALSRWDLYFGGQARQGRGRLGIAGIDMPDPQPYLDHLEQHRETLREGLISGKLGSDKVLCRG